MAQDKPNTPLEGLVLGIVGVGNSESLGWNFLCRLILEDSLAKNGIIGSKRMKLKENGEEIYKRGITKIYIYDVVQGKTTEVIAQMRKDMEKKKNQDSDDEKKDEEDAILKKQCDDGTFSIEPARDISVIAEKTDICFLLYDKVSAAMRRTLLTKTSKRGVSFPGNIEVMEAWKKKECFKDYKGLVMCASNPTDYLTYFGADILSLERNQIVGFNHVDTERLLDELKELHINALPINLDELDEKEKRKTIKALENKEFNNVAMVGNHSDECFGHYSFITLGQDKVPWNNDKILSKKEVKENSIDKKVHQRAKELSKAIGSPNDNCVTALVEVLKSIVTGRGTVGMSYYIDSIKDNKVESIEELLIPQIEKKYDIKIGNLSIKGICTGLPVEFYFDKDAGGIRARLAKRYNAGKHTLNISGWATEEGYNEKTKFLEIAKKNIEAIAEAIIFKQREGKYRWLDEKEIPVAYSLNSHKIALGSYNLGVLECEEEKVSNKKYHPNICCFATEQNKLVAASRQKRKSLHIVEFPYIENLGVLIRGAVSKPKPKNIDLGKFDGKLITNMGLSGDNVYLAEDERIEKRDIRNLKISEQSKDYPFKITSLSIYDNNIFCGTDKGEIKKIDGETLEVIDTYIGTDATQVNHIKMAEYNFEKDGKRHKKKYLFGVTSSNEVYMWDLDLKKPAISLIKTANECFDVQQEEFKGEPLLCMYFLDRKYDVIIAPIFRAEALIHGTQVQKAILNQEDFKSKISNILEKPETIQYLEAKGDRVLLLSDRGLTVANKNGETERIKGGFDDMCKDKCNISQVNFVKVKT